VSNARGPLPRLQHEIAAAVAGLSAEQLSQHAAGKWCAAEILEHLYLTYTGSIKGFNRVLEAGKPLATNVTWKNRAQALVVVSLGYLPSGRESPSMARPRGLAPERVVAEIEPKIAEMDDVISQCESKFGASTKLLDHPFIGPLSGGQWRKFHLVHGRHHVKQILALRREMNGGPA
jgi:hypothetical protein